MKKKALIFLLLACLSLMLLVGCDNKNDDISNNDINSNNEMSNDNIEADKQEDELHVTFDAYGFSGGILSVTEVIEGNEPTVTEGISWNLPASKNEKFSDILMKNGITSIEPKSEEDTFEGWIQYKVEITTDEDGFDTYRYEKMSDETLYTTEEILNMTMPEHNVLFVAKWAGLAMSDYEFEDISTEPVMDNV